MNQKKMVAAFLAAAMIGASGVNAFAASLNAPKAQAASTQKASNSTGIFTGSTPLVQYLYQAFTDSPSSLHVPVSLFTATEIEAQFEELGQAAIEAYIQNGMTDYVEDFQYQYTSGQSEITMQVIYANRDDSSRSAQSAQLAAAADAVIASVITPDMSVRAKAQALSNYIAQNVLYDFDGFKQYQSGQDVNHLQASYAALVGKKAICQGFARAYKLLCDKAGIPCVVIFGKTKQFNTAHAWNRIYLDGKWETVDASNPQLVINRIGSFCIPAETVFATLQADGTKTFVHAQASKYLA